MKHETRPYAYSTALPPWKAEARDVSRLSRRSPWRLGWVVFALGITACTADGQLTSSNQSALDPDSGLPYYGDAPDSDDPDELFGYIEVGILEPSCRFPECHGGGAAAESSLDLSADAAQTLLDGVGSSGDALVVPGDPDASYLIAKLVSQAPAMGTQMPPDAPLGSDQIAVVRRWIRALGSDADQ